MVGVILTPIAVVAHPFDHQRMDMGSSPEGTVEGSRFHVEGDGIAMKSLSQPGKRIIAAHRYPGGHGNNKAPGFFAWFQFTFQPGAFHGPQWLFPTVKAFRILDHLAGRGRRFRFQQVDLLPIWSCNNFALFIEIGAFRDDQVTQLHFLAVTCTDPGHRCKAWAKLLQNQAEIQARLHGSPICRPGHQDTERFVARVADRGVAVGVAAHLAKGALEGDAATRGELMEDCLCFFIHGTDDTDIKYVAMFFHGFPYLYEAMSQPLLQRTARGD